MSWLTRLLGQDGASQLKVDPHAGALSGAAHVSPYDLAGNILVPANRGILVDTVGGALNSGKDYKLARSMRVSSTGGQHVAGDGSFMLHDAFEGTTRNLNQWVETIATATSAQTLANGLRLNTGSSLVSGQGVLESSHRQFPLVARAGLVFRARLRVQGATNCFEEFGFGDTISATTPVINNGAFFRRDGAGSLQPILSFNGTEGAGPTMAQPLTTESSWYEIFLEDDRATFQITDAQGALISAQIMERGATGGSGAGVKTQARLFAVTHLPCFLRVYNSGTAVTAPQIDATHASVTFADGLSQRDHRVAMAGMGYDGLTSPTAYTQLANWANSTVPANGALSNTVASYTTLGGLFRFAATTGAETDYALFGWQNPSPYTFYCTGISISQLRNEVVAVATSASVFEWAAAFNSSAVSLATAAPYSPMRIALGAQAFAIAAAIAAMTGGSLEKSFNSPKAVQPGKFLHIILRLPIGTATATEFFRGMCSVDGFFE